MRAKIIVNSKSVKSPEEIGEKIKRYLRGSGIVSEYVLTEYAGHAEHLAENSDGYDTLIAVGGDGTVHEVTNEIKKSKKDKMLGIAPLGGGNDTARSLDIYSRNLDRMCYSLCDGETRLIDVGSFNGRYFVSSAGIGLTAEAVKNKDKLIPRLFPPLRYFLSAVISDKKPKEMEIYIEGKKVAEGRKMAVIGMNTRFAGNGMDLCDGKMDDGILNFLVVGEMGALEFLYNLKKASHGTRIIHPEVEYREGRDIYIRTEELVSVQLDGEMFKDNSGKICYLQDMHFGIEPKSLRVIC